MCKGRVGSTPRREAGEEAPSSLSSEGQEEVRVEAPRPRLTPLARVIHRLVGLHKEVAPARREEQVDALNACIFGQRTHQPG